MIFGISNHLSIYAWKAYARHKACMLDNHAKAASYYLLSHWHRVFEKTIASLSTQGMPSIIIDAIEYCDHPRQYEKYIHEVATLIRCPPPIGDLTSTSMSHLLLEVSHGYWHEE